MDVPVSFYFESCLMIFDVLIQMNEVKFGLFLKCFQKDKSRIQYLPHLDFKQTFKYTLNYNKSFRSSFIPFQNGFQTTQR